MRSKGFERISLFLFLKPNFYIKENLLQVFPKEINLKRQFGRNIDKILQMYR